LSGEAIEPSLRETIARHRRVAVTALADFACRSGDLEQGGGTVGPSSRDGVVAHQRLQAASEAETEVRLTRRLVVDGEMLELSGRVDLLDRDRHALGEIKSTLVPLERLPPSRRALHRAQLMLYGWLYLGEVGEGVPLTLELVYVNLRGGAPVTETLAASVEALEGHAVGALSAWLRWRLGVERRRAALASSAAALSFPHERFRAGQRTMAVAVYRALRDGGGLLCEAPTGTGKTISSLYPAVKALGEGRRRQVFYLTAKVSGRRSALESLGRLVGAGLELSALALRARESACFCERGDVTRDAAGRCPMTLGFFDRLPPARAELVEAGVIGAERLDECARRHRLCPHALAARLLPWMDVVVGDYNHVFDPLARLSGLDEPNPAAVLLVDEAHNLLERSRAMFSASLSREACAVVAAACRLEHPSVAHAIERLGEGLRELARGRTEGTALLGEIPRALARRAGETLEAIAATFGEVPPLPAEATSLARRLARFALVAELYGEEYRTLLVVRRVGRRREIEIRLVCLDAAALLARQSALFGASVLFSATLAPAGFYRDALGMPRTTPTLALPSPFDPEHSLHCVVDWVDTRFRRREDSLEALVRLIRQVSESHAGNYLVFLPSYLYLERVHVAFARAHPERETWRQLPGEGAEEQARTLARLERPGHRVGFAVLGGAYGEGVDYAGHRLIGVLVVGTGLPGPTLERDLIASRYDERGLDGFDFAARYPGFTRVQQAVGRLIRGERDHGVVVLVDDRFRQPFYRRLFPPHWRSRPMRDAAELDERLEQFWRGVPESVHRSSSAPPA